MGPIYDTDIAQKCWQQDDWKNYELLEKVEQRQKRKKRLWILSAGFLFLVLSAIPIFMDRWDKWVTLSICRHLAQEINEIKQEAAVMRAAYRIRFEENGKLNYRIEKASSCTQSSFIPVRSGSLGDSADYHLVSSAEGGNLKIPGLIESFCYDPLVGAFYSSRLELAAFGLIPVKDLSEQRTDRLSLLLLQYASAEISFD